MAKTQTAQKQLEENYPGKNNDTLAWALSGLAAIAYYFYSFKSSGLYQHDEIAHLMNMYEFWDKPSSILGNWPKTGYKLVYAIPALLGSKFLVILNCLLAALSCFLVYKTTQFFDKRFAILALLLLATQPMWTEISFRNYADSFSGLVLIAALYFHYKEKYILSSLLMSFSTLVRQEFFLVAIPYGVYFLFQKRWAPAFLLALFPVLYNVWGAAVTGDPLYLINSSKATSDLYGDQFARYGFFHFFRMSMIVWGSVAVVLSVVFSVQVINGTVKKTLGTWFTKNPWFILIPALIYLLIHSLFNHEDLKLGASPNLRYMNGISPLLAVMGALAVANWDKLKSKATLYLSVAGVALLFYYFYSAHDHNGVLLDETKDDYKLFFLGVVTAALLLANLKSAAATWVFGALALISGALALKPKQPAPEDLAIKNMVTWISKEKKDQNQLFTNHNLVPYYYDKITGHLPKDMKSLDSSGIANAPVGTLVVIESHYSLRKDFPAPAESIREAYLADRDFNKAVSSFMQINNGNYQVLNQFVSKDQGFGAILFERVK